MNIQMIDVGVGMFLLGVSLSWIVLLIQRNLCGFESWVQESPSYSVLLGYFKTHPKSGEPVFNQVRWNQYQKALWTFRVFVVVVIVLISLGGFLAIIGAIIN